MSSTEPSTLSSPLFLAAADTTNVAAGGTGAIPVSSTALAQASDHPSGGWPLTEPLPLLLVAAGTIAAALLVTTLLRRQRRQPHTDPLLEAMPEGTLLIDNERRITAHNSRAHKLLPAEKGKESLTGMNARNFYASVCADSTQAVHKLDHWLSNLHADRTSSIEIEDAEQRHLLIRERPIDADRIAATVSDITERKHLDAQLEFVANYDRLTGLVNRDRFMQQLQQLAAGDRPEFVVLICDLRDFRQINDSYGQRNGDKLLIAIARLLIERMPADSVIGRLAGDEFGVLIPENLSTSALQRCTDGLLEDMSSGIDTGSFSIPVRTSIGISRAPTDGVTYSELKSAADSACTQAKLAGRHTVANYDRQWQHQAERHHQIDIGLIDALRRDEYHLQYQPQVDIKSHLTVGMEALLRWTSPVLGHVSPGEFVPRAERSDQIISMGEWVLEKSIEDYQRLAQFGMSPATLSVNVSRKQFSRPELTDNIKRIINNSGIDPALLTLEITETAILDDRKRTISMLKALHDFGVKLSVDDFGVGYSSFAELRDFPISEVKIDRTFVADFNHCEQSRQIIKATVDVARSIGAEVVAEGIETLEQFRLAEKLGCHRAQGYFLCEPMTPTLFPDLCLGGNRLAALTELDSPELDATIVVSSAPRS